MCKQPNIKHLKYSYKKAKDAKVGELVECPSCHTKFTKTNYQQAFCKSKQGTTCKDFFWNNVTPSKRNNTTRISPANKAFMKERELYPKWEGDLEEGWDGHKDTF